MRVTTQQGGYDITIGEDIRKKAGEIFDLDRRVLVVTDDGVPKCFADDVAAQCREAVRITLPQGEASKNVDAFTTLLAAMLRNGFTRTDCAVAVGGGVVGDLTGFAAACYMRGIDFYNIPTTVLSQVDSSIGGKTAIDFLGYKNVVGAFHQPKGVLVDTATLSTLSKRQCVAGFAEAVKMAAAMDAGLFSLFETRDIFDHDAIREIIERSLMIKKSVVEQDEREAGLRKALNFGHTVGHAVESIMEGKLYHGECVAIGMLPMCAPTARARLKAVLERLNLPTEIPVPFSELADGIRHDKKAGGDSITTVRVPEIGRFEFKTQPVEEFIKEIGENL